MKLYRLDCAEIGAEEMRIICEHFPQRFERSMRYIDERDRLLCAASAVLLYRVLGLHDEGRIKTLPSGKPYIDGGPAFSISHSGERCILAVSEEGTVGIDIEKLDESNLIAAPAVLTAAEFEWMSTSPLERFHILWTRKESIYKALGGSDDPKMIDALNAADRDRLHIASLVSGGYALSICAEEPFDLPEPIDIGAEFTKTIQQT